MLPNTSVTYPTGCYCVSASFLTQTSRFVDDNRGMLVGIPLHVKGSLIFQPCRRLHFVTNQGRFEWCRVIWRKHSALSKKPLDLQNSSDKGRKLSQLHTPVFRSFEEVMHRREGAGRVPHSRQSVWRPSDTLVRSPGFIHSTEQQLLSREGDNNYGVPLKALIEKNERQTVSTLLEIQFSFVSNFYNYIRIFTQ